MSYPNPAPQNNNGGLPFALPPIVTSRLGVSTLSIVLGVTSVMGLFRSISVQIRYGLALDPISALMGYSIYIVGVLAALVLWTLRPAAGAKTPQLPNPAQFGQTDPAVFNPAVSQPNQLYPQPTQLYTQAPSPAPVQPPFQPAPGAQTYAQFDDLLGDTDTR